MSQINKIDHFEEEGIASEKPFEDNDLIRLPAEGQKAPVEDILNPPEPTPALLRAKELYTRIVRKAC